MQVARPGQASQVRGASSGFPLRARQRRSIEDDDQDDKHNVVVAAAAATNDDDDDKFPGQFNT